jgi:hypothetical protein
MNSSEVPESDLQSRYAEKTDVKHVDLVKSEVSKESL